MILQGAQTDEQLLERIRLGNRLAFDELYLKYWMILYDAAYKRLNDRQLSEDIVQNVFTRLWVRREELAIDKVGAYLHSAVRYKVLSYFSRNKSTSSFYEPFETLLTELDTPERHLLAKELLDLIYDFADTLSERKRQILLLHVKKELSTKEIAEIMGVTQKTVQNQLGPILKHLRKSLILLVLIVIYLFF